MKSKPFTYLFTIQYLGYRYHGWQKQPGVKTIQQVLERSFRGWLGHSEFNILGAGRTDAGVSCANGAFELFSAKEVPMQGLLEGMNSYLPDDVRLLSVKPIGPDFNIIQDVKEKEYRYYFSFGQKPNPISAPHVVVFSSLLDVARMKTGAALFQGLHDFRNFCTKPKPDADFQREMLLSQLDEHGMADPDWELAHPIYCFRVRAKGFMRNQVRLMMGALYELGNGELELEQLENALSGKLAAKPLAYIAPPSGLVLQEVVF